MQVQTRLLFKIAIAQEQHQQDFRLPSPAPMACPSLQPILKCEDLITGLEDEYNRNVRPIMDYLQQLKSAMGERYPEAMFLPPVLTSDADREKMLSGMRVRPLMLGWQDARPAAICASISISDSLYHSNLHSIHLRARRVAGLVGLLAQGAALVPRGGPAW